jgi:enoyl-CoA hydratase/carnithine racemase
MFIREDSRDVAVVRLAHGKVSALDAELCEALVGEISSIAADPSIALVVTGTGSAFSAGVDLFKVLDGGEPYLNRFLPALEAILQTLLTFPKPAVAAVNGHAIAGGCIIAAACDHRLMIDGPARIGIPELIVGVPFPALPLEIVGARVPPAALRQLVLTGRTVKAMEARELGLIDEVIEADALMPRAREVAEQLALIPPLSFALTKRAFCDPLLDRGRAAADRDAEVATAWASPAVHARIREYLAKTIVKKG